MYKKVKIQFPDVYNDVLFQCRFPGRSESFSCPKSEFPCPATETCIPASWKCDGENDCSDEKDESDCGEYALRSTLCRLFVAQWLEHLTGHQKVTGCTHM